MTGTIAFSDDHALALMTAGGVALEELCVVADGLRTTVAVAV